MPTQVVGLFTLSQGSPSSFQSAGADPPPLKGNWSAEEVVGLWTLKMVDPLSTQYFLIQLQVGINHFFLNSLTNEKGVSNKKNCNHAQQHHDFRVLHLLQTFVRSLLAVVLGLVRN